MPTEVLPEYSSILHALRFAAEHCPQRTAIECEHRSITYAQLWGAVLNLASRLVEMGEGHGRVAIARSNSIDTVVACLGVMAAGSTAVMLNPFFPSEDVSHLLEISGVNCVLTQASLREKLEISAQAVNVARVLCWPEEMQPEDNQSTAEAGELPGGNTLALSIFTGGTTGRPKAVNHTHQALATSMRLHCTVWPLSFDAERFLSAAPLFHVWGLVYATFIPIYTRGTLYLLPKFNAESVLQALQVHRISVFGGGPAPVYFGLLANPCSNKTDFSALKYSLSGGAPCPNSVRVRWEQLTGAPFLEGWGMSEGAPLCLSPVHGPRKANSVGPAVPETQLQIVDTETGENVLASGQLGEVRVRGPQLMAGYRNESEATARAMRNGWLYTGDLGKLDTDGYLFLLGRKKDMVLVGGYNVYPRQVEERLLTHQSVTEVACVGVPDERLGEVLVAFTVCRVDNAMKEDDFHSFGRQHLVKYCRPERVHFLTSLPRTQAHKLDLRLLKQWAIEPQQIGAQYLRSEVCHSFR